jgi:hypothetical protein
MKKHILLGFLVILILATFSCHSKKESVLEEEQEKVVIEKNPTILTITNHSFLTEEDVGETLTITGVLSGEKGNWVLTENASSKSRVTFVLEVPTDLELELEQLVSEKVTVTGTLTNVYGTWKKAMTVTEIANK